METRSEAQIAARAEARRAERSHTVLPWVLVGICLLGVLLQTVDSLRQGGGRLSLIDLVEFVGWGLAVPLPFSVLGALILTRQPGNRVGWLMMVVAIASPLRLLLANLTEDPAELTPGIWLLLWIDSWKWLPHIFALFLIPLHFPTGRPPSARWNWVNWLALALWLVFIAFIALMDEIGPLEGDWRVSNPLGVIPASAAEGPFMVVWLAGLVTMLAASVTSLLVRFRRARPDERQQIKWLLYAGALFILAFVPSMALSGNEVWTSTGLGILFPVLAALAIPTAMAISILRYRLWDIDILIRRTLVYGVLTALLALLYLGSVVLLEGMLRPLIGQDTQLAVVFSTLVIAALFTPLRRRVQGFMDRRFYRTRYDAQRTLAGFGARLRERENADLDRLSGELVEVIQRTVQPAHLSLWLRESQARVPASGRLPSNSGDQRDPGRPSSGA